MNSNLSIEDIQAEKWLKNILDNKFYDKMRYLYKVSLMNNENIENLEKICNEKINYEKKMYQKQINEYEEKIKEVQEQYREYKLKIDNILKEKIDSLKDDNLQKENILKEEIEYLKSKNENIKLETENHYKEMKINMEENYKKILESKDEYLKDKTKQIENFKNLTEMFNLNNNKTKGDFQEKNDYANLINAYSNNASFRILDTNRDQGMGDLFVELENVRFMIECKNLDDSSMKGNFKALKKKFLKNFENAKRENKVDIGIMSFNRVKGIPVYDGSKYRHGMINNIEYEIENFENINQDCLLIYVPQSGKNDGFNLVNAIRMSLRVYNNLNCTSSADIKMKIRKCQKILHDSRTNMNEIISMEERFHNEMKQKLESSQKYITELLDYVFDDDTQYKKSDYENSIRSVISHLKSIGESITKDNIKKFKSKVTNLEAPLKISDIDSLLQDKSWKKKYCEEEKE